MLTRCSKFVFSEPAFFLVRSLRGRFSSSITAHETSHRICQLSLLTLSEPFPKAFPQAVLARKVQCSYWILSAAVQAFKGLWIIKAWPISKFLDKRPQDFQSSPSTSN